MAMPTSNTARIRHAFESSPQRAALLLLAKDIDLLLERCACVNTVVLVELTTPDDDGIDSVEFDEDDVDPVL